MSKKNSILNIQLLRAFAAILVILHHALPHYQEMGGSLNWIEIISAWGFAGVDIFFVISGFIMATTTFDKERTLINAASFFTHRLLRIFLGYWPFLLSMTLIIFIINPSKIPHLDIFGSIFLSNANMFQLTLPISWSLSYELYFYFLFLFTFFISIKYLYVLIPILVTFLLGYILFISDNNSFFLSPFLLEFFAGVLLFMYKNYLMKIWLLPFIIIFLLISYGIGIENELKNGIYRIATFGSGAFFLILLALILENKKIYVANRFFSSLGDASYTLYLSHLIILELFWISGARDLFTGGSTVLPFFGLIVILVLCIVFSLNYYKLVEYKLYLYAIKHTKLKKNIK